MPCCARLGLGQAAPGHFGIGEDHGGDRARVVDDLAAGGRLGGHLGLGVGLVGQHGFAGDVADGEDVRFGGAALAVDDLTNFRFSSSLMAVFSRPMPGIGRRPIETSTLSNVSTGSVRRWRSFERHLDAAEPVSSSFATFVSMRKPANFVSSRRFSSETRSRSAPGNRPLVISTTLTWLPSDA
jgi:hypothetical protein